MGHKFPFLGTKRQEPTTADRFFSLKPPEEECWLLLLGLINWMDANSFKVAVLLLFLHAKSTLEISGSCSTRTEQSSSYWKLLTGISILVNFSFKSGNWKILEITDFDSTSQSNSVAFWFKGIVSSFSSFPENVNCDQRFGIRCEMIIAKLFIADLSPHFERVKLRWSCQIPMANSKPEEP